MEFLIRGDEKEIRTRSLSMQALAGEMFDDALCCQGSIADTVGDADAPIGSAGEDQPAIAAQCTFDLFHSLQMPQQILRHGLHPAIDFDIGGFRRHTADLLQFCLHLSDQRLIIELENRFTPDAADIATDQ